MPLTDAKCRAAKPQSKTKKLSDGEGMFLQVDPNGSKIWRCSYRWQGKQRTATFGRYPATGLATARLKRAELRGKLEEGLDPTKEADANHSFRSVAKEWFKAREARWVSGYAARIWSRLEEDMFPTLGDKDVSVIEPPQVLTALRKIEDRDAIELAKRVRQSTSQIFRYAIANGYCKTDPAEVLSVAMRTSPPQKHRAALKEAELPEFFQRLRGYSGERATALGLEIIAHTFVRSSELRLATWPEIQGAVWKIPAERMKMRKEHHVPLSAHVQGLFAQLKVLAGESPWVLPGVTERKPISENTLIFGLYRAGYASRATVHGFRGTASTILNESGKWRPDAIERQLAHVPENEVRSAYNAATYWPERVEMMNYYSDLLFNASNKSRSSTDLTELLT